MKPLDRVFPASPGARSGPSLTVGLINNAADRGLKATEQQFCDLIRAGSSGINLQFKLFTCAGVPRSNKTAGIRDSYADVGALLGTHLDALIVTGMQPQAKTLQEEPVWTSLTKVADWAELHAVPTIWSCLAAHAFVLHFDGIPRCRLPEKMSGIFECALPPDRNRLTQGLPSTWFSPHSRYHGLPEDQLVAAGYQILSWSNEAGADIVLKSGAVPTLLFQGHPEYAGDTLLREYMRDIRRYRDGEHREYPIAPRSYFDRETAIALDLFRRIALERHQAPALSEISSLVDSAAYPCQWRLPAARLIENWLALVVESGAPFRRFPGRSTGTPAAFSDARSGLVP